MFIWTVSSAVEHRIHIAGATGSNPVPSTKNNNANCAFFCFQNLKTVIFSNLFGIYSVLGVEIGFFKCYSIEYLR